MIVLDTDICFEILRGKEKVLRRRLEYAGEIAVSFMTAAELHYGAENSRHVEENRLVVEKFLLTVPVLEPDAVILRRFGLLKAGLKRRNILLPDADLFIAAVTLEKGEALATGNERHFNRIEGLTLLNWLK